MQFHLCSIEYFVEIYFGFYPLRLAGLVVVNDAGAGVEVEEVERVVGTLNSLEGIEFAEVIEGAIWGSFRGVARWAKALFERVVG